MEKGCFNSYLDCDIKTLCDNFKAIKKHVGNKDLIPIIKGDGYGFGDVEVARALTPLGAELVAVAMACEGVKLRENGINNPILILGGYPEHNIPFIVKYDMQVPIFTIEGARAINEEAKKQGKVISAHIKLNTGMNRVGTLVGDKLAKLLEELKTLTNVKVIGVFTHFSNADYENDPFTLEQYEAFKKGVEQIKADGSFDLKYIHCQNSPSTYWLKDDICTHVRPGAVLYGYLRMADGSEPMDVRDAMSLRTYITAINEVNVGESVGYSRFYKPTRPSKIATISIGYACGLFRPMTRRTDVPVLVNDSFAHYAGCCMDQAFVDVTDIDCKVGDEVTIYGYSKGGAHISPCELADITGMAVQMFVSTVTSRVAKIYKD